MRKMRPALYALLFASFLAFTVATPPLALRHGEDEMPPMSTSPSSISHSTHSTPLVELDEAALIAVHGPDLPSYWTHDFGGPADNKPPSEDSKKGLMILHVIGMSLAFFGALPLAIVLRSAGHSWHTFAQAGFLGLVFVGSTAGTLYSRLTPNLYQGSSHGLIGYITLALVTILSTIDSLPLLLRLWAFARHKSGRPASLGGFWKTVILGSHAVDGGVEYDGLMACDDPGEETASLEGEAGFSGAGQGATSRHRRFSSTDQPISPWSNDPEHESPLTAISSPSASSSHHTFVGSPIRISLEKGLHDYERTEKPRGLDSHDEPQRNVRQKLLFFGRLVFAITERLLLFLAFLQLIGGTTVYAGQCRGSYIHSCAAHFIKGGIFWAYGILTWCRYLGAFADLGWAWNRPPFRSRSVPTAEAVESLVIFAYGASNTWMERFGSKPGSPFTTKEYQHISIAVMFWFAGLVGLGMESKTLRKWLGASAVSTYIRKGIHSPLNAVDTPLEIQEPPSYSGSFNPFPALVIGITGAAMSAHHQTYVFQVQIHALWGFLLSFFAIFRFLTYFFLWLRPPKSILPSRPPTEALGSFCLATGGLVFILSSEEITFAAMRRGHDDMMMIMNLVAAVTSLVFCWFLFVLGVKGWAVSQALSMRRQRVATI